MHRPNLNFTHLFVVVMTIAFIIRNGQRRKAAAKNESEECYAELSHGGHRKQSLFRLGRKVKTLLQFESLVHQALQARLVQQVVSEFFVREHSQRRTFSPSGQLGSFFNGHVGILADHRHHHADHDLQPANLLGF